MVTRYKLGVIGCGRWGPNLLRNFYNHRAFEVVWVCDTDEERRQHICELYPAMVAGHSFEELQARHPVDVAVIATPVETHFSLAMKAIKLGCHVFIEKPLAANVEQTRQLVEASQRRQRLLFVDFTYLFHPDINFINKLVNNGSLGDRLLYYTSTRVNWGPARRDVNAISDLAVHDFAIMQCIFPEQPLAIAATGVCHVPHEPVDQAFVTCYYSNDFIAHINVNWFAPTKVRRLYISGNKRIIDYDELNPLHQILIYDCQLPNVEELPNVDRLNQGMHIWAPERSNSEPLRLAVEEFWAHLSSGHLATANSDLSLRVSRMLETANTSLSQHGTAIEFKP